VILLWLGLTALMQSSVTLIPHDLLPGADWAQLFWLCSLQG